MYNQLADIFSHAPALDGKKQAMSYLSVERVFIALNKCDLWAVQEGFRGEAQEELQKRSPFMLFHELLGDGMINTLRTWLAPTTKIAIGCTSSFGFIDGGPNAPLMNGVSFGPDLRAEEIGAWQPYQVFDPFLFLASGKRTSSNVVQCTVEELDSKVG